MYFVVVKLRMVFNSVYSTVIFCCSQDCNRISFSLLYLLEREKKKKRKKETLITRATVQPVKGFPTASSYMSMQNLLSQSISQWKRTEESTTCDEHQSHHLTQSQIACAYYEELLHINISRAELEDIWWLQQ